METEIEDDLPEKRPKEFQLGVLIVHGIGTQPSGESLVQWGEALLKVVRCGTKVVPIIERAGQGDAVNSRAEAVIKFGSEDKAERWLLAEGWWAESFPSPTYPELVTWSLRALPWSVCIHVAQCYWQAVNQKTKWQAKILPCITAVGQLLIVLSLTPLFISLLTVALLIGILPIAQLRTQILSAQSALSATVGDCLVFLESPIRAAFIRTRILDELSRLKKVCERTVIIAHSQGAAVALDALHTINKTNQTKENKTQPHTSTPSPLPDVLVSFGAGIKKLESLKQLLVRSAEKPSFQNLPYILLSTFLATIALLAKLFWDVIILRVSISQFIEAALLWFSGTYITAFLGYWSAHYSGVLYARWTNDQNQVDTFKKWIAFLVFMLGLVGTLIYAHYSNLPFGLISYLGAAVALFLASTATLLSKKLENFVNAPVKMPLGLNRWLDFYASADPVPNGPTRPSNKEKQMDSEQIWNQGSFLADHTVYWNNLDSFVLSTLRVCAETAMSPWKDDVPPETQSIDDRAKWRVWFLKFTRWITGSAWLYIFTRIWWHDGTSIPLLFNPPDWLPPMGVTATSFISLAVAIGFLGWLTLGILRWIWKLWVHTEQEAILDHKPPSGNWIFWVISMMTVTGAVLELAIFPERIETILWESIDNLEHLFNLVMPPIGFGVFSLLLILWLKYPPQWSYEEKKRGQNNLE